MDIVGTVTAPARLSIRVALWGVRSVGGLLPFGYGDEPAPPGPTVEEPPARPEPAAETVARPTPAAPPPPEPEPPEPAHVDEEATLVAEFAEGGAEDGAGAEVELAEPWEGYDRLHADDVIDRLVGATTEELAAVLLYERGNRNRPSVIEAGERRLRSAT